MKTYIVTIAQAVWETDQFQIQLPDTVDPDEFVNDNRVDLLMGNCQDTEHTVVIGGVSVTITPMGRSVGDVVDGLSTNTEVEEV